jgi:hypothetical protein
MYAFLLLATATLIISLRRLYIWMNYTPANAFELPIQQSPTPTLEPPLPPTYPIPEIDIPIVCTPTPAAINHQQLGPENVHFFLCPIHSCFWPPLTQAQWDIMVPDATRPGWAWVPDTWEEMYRAHGLRQREHMMEYGVTFNQYGGAHFPGEELQEGRRGWQGCMVM